MLAATLDTDVIRLAKTVLSSLGLPVPGVPALFFITYKPPSSFKLANKPFTKFLSMEALTGASSFISILPPALLVRDSGILYETPYSTEPLFITIIEH